MSWWDQCWLPTSSPNHRDLDWGAGGSLPQQPLFPGPLMSHFLDGLSPTRGERREAERTEAKSRSLGSHSWS